jgi:hypothetical protein
VIGDYLVGGEMSDNRAMRQHRLEPFFALRLRKVKMLIDLSLYAHTRYTVSEGN